LTVVLQKIHNGLMQSYDFRLGKFNALGKERDVFEIFDCIFNLHDLPKAMTLFEKLLETAPEVHTNNSVMQLFMMIFINELIPLNMVVLQASHEIFLAMAHLVCKHYMWKINQLGDHKFALEYCNHLNEMDKSANSFPTSLLFMTEDMLFTLHQVNIALSLV
jgi:hypothetical protein